MKPIASFQDFCAELLEIGFSIGGENPEGVFSLCSQFEAQINWHTSDPETDPWEWRMRVLNERTDIAYSKLFFRKSGYITQKWYPYFLAVRRTACFADAYYAGTVSETAKRIYDLIEENGTLPLHMIKRLGHFEKEDKSAFDRAITDLQMGLFITMCGQQRKTSLQGEEYGWSATSFCTVESFWGQELLEEAQRLDPREAEAAVAARILQINPQAKPQKIVKFIRG